jgi:hypothetical protein
MLPIKQRDASDVPSSRLGIGFLCGVLPTKKAENSRVKTLPTSVRKNMMATKLPNFEKDPPGPLDAE